MKIESMNLGAILERHRELLESSAPAAAARGERPDPSALSLDDQIGRRARLVERRKERRQARDRAVARFDQEIAAIDREIAVIDELLDKADKAEKGGGTRPTPPSPRGRGKGGGKDSGLGEIEGVGPAYRKRLEDAGYRAAGMIAAATPESLAEKAGLAVGRAKAIIESAKKLLSRGG